MHTVALRLFATSGFPRHVRAVSWVSRAPKLVTQISPPTTFRVPRSCFTRWMLCSTGDLVSAIREKNVQNKVVIYSRSWCPFCDEVKKLFASYNVTPKIIELDDVVEGDDIQDALVGITGSRTVPQVFVDGEYIGGCDDGQGKLKPLLDA